AVAAAIAAAVAAAVAVAGVAAAAVTAVASLAGAVAAAAVAAAAAAVAPATVPAASAAPTAGVRRLTARGDGHQENDTVHRTHLLKRTEKPPRPAAPGSGLGERSRLGHLSDRQSRLREEREGSIHLGYPYESPGPRTTRYSPFAPVPDLT